MRFLLREQETLRRVSNGHPFLVQLKESFQNDRYAFLITEYTPCGNIGRILGLSEGRRFSEQVAKNYICEIILAIEHLHSKNIVYRDLKPENILIGEDGHLKLTDFGHSKQIEIEYDLSESEIGSHAYRTPEMLKHEPHGKSIDWYGVGAVLYEFIASVPPYFANSLEMLTDNILNQKNLKIPSQ